MTPKQEKFAQCVADGMTQADAYRSSYDCENSSDAVIHNEASLLMQSREIAIRVAQLREQLSAKALWTREMSVAALQDVLYNPDKQADKIAAVKELNLMHGYNAPQKLDLSSSDKSMSPVQVDQDLVKAVIDRINADI
jgi:hypothetical protein